MTWPGHSVLQVPVPPLEAFVRGRHAHYDPAWVSADPAFVHAHVTALGPWLADPGPADLAVVGEVAAALAPFDVVLERVATFPNGIVHLLPEPDGPFRELTTRLAEAFPQCPPYAGEFAPVPHLTLDLASAEVTEASIRELLGDLVPATCRATSLDLAWYEADGCRLLHRWPLGG
ncbi:2'-5' RNA ligase family protein [Nocardioides marmotae]|uniref:2'-5' RNA ligase family protein n=1 Tax=Nocardioides marmotae TaxID=2663857 RepID=A0A6I3JB75_9ACTN|nr:2'-5' RNA ligase family protein [Nocardioides marmotae]MCR6031738.1 2'-5' RNA ligase family protein [Gordonia jinghuaiqii]MBC9735049.1 2'-5' RNA ligase family protein [Nocardioides marmotae]MTB86149.1 2'-5' RNA ligase family protein [Nocardioides marmotae]MTB95377.1 2'-5' RNA ligase family protein [Nocardioides marmotae]QKE00825.1 2'-5' RNA ligase family protein [Nocardioides marmotae]